LLIERLTVCAVAGLAEDRAGAIGRKPHDAIANDIGEEQIARGVAGGPFGK
jgi:hypothetical protein